MYSPKCPSLRALLSFLCPLSLPSGDAAADGASCSVGGGRAESAARDEIAAAVQTIGAKKEALMARAGALLAAHRIRGGGEVRTLEKDSHF